MKPVLLALVLALALAAPAHASQHSRVLKSHLGTTRAQFSFKYESSGNRFWKNGRVKIWQNGKLIVNHPYGYGFSGALVMPKLHVRDLDGVAPPEVIVDAYSGGAHCCGMSEIYTGKHRVHHDWGQFEVPGLRDVDGDGKPEWHFLDTAFAYAFGSFAGSAYPVKVSNYANNAVHDVTKSYPAEVEADMAKWYSEYQKAAAEGGGSEYVRSSLAAYAADAHTLGQGPAAMAVVQAAVTAGQTQGGTSESDPAWDGDYIAQLTKMLHDLGYS